MRKRDEDFIYKLKDIRFFVGIVILFGVLILVFLPGFVKNDWYPFYIIFISGLIVFFILLTYAIKYLETT